jgi:hypothetical protein
MYDNINQYIYTMKELIEDYKRRLKTIEETIADFKSTGSISDVQKGARLNAKASEYRTFIAELERIDNVPDILKKIDWTTLRTQKTALLQAIEKALSMKNEELVNNLDGILALIDALQDYAVDVIGVPEMLVFDFEKEENREFNESTGLKDSTGNELYVGDKLVKLVKISGDSNVTKLLCAGCNSDNLDISRKSPRKFEGKTIVDIWCNDCQEFHPAYEATFKSKKYKVEGFQVVSNDEDGNIHPSMPASFCLYNLSQAREMIKKGCKNKSQSWRLVTCWTNDVEDPTLMFEGDPRN